MNINTTPVPNIVFDVCLRDLKLAELKVLLIIIRQTLGWEDKKNNSRKKLDWISNSQLVTKTGNSARAINDAIQGLTDKKLIDVISQSGEFLDTPEKRRGQQKLYFRYTNVNSAIVETKGIEREKDCKTIHSNANFADNLRKNITELTHKMRITKETLQN